MSKVFFYFIIFCRGAEHKDWKYDFEKKNWGGLPGGPINVLTVYPEHKAVTAAACHSQIPSWGSFTSEALLLSLSCFLISPNLPLHLCIVFFSQPTQTRSLSPSSSFKFHKVSAARKDGSYIPVCLREHPDLLLRFRAPEELENIWHTLLSVISGNVLCLRSKITSHAAFISGSPLIEFLKKWRI